jgi:hypothetical protein
MMTLNNATTYDLYNEIELEIMDWIENEDDERTAQDLIDWAATKGVLITREDIQRISYDLDEM